MAAGFITARKREEPEREQASKMEIMVFYNHISEVTLAPIYSLIASHWVQPTLKGRGSYRTNTRRRDHWGPF